MRVHLKLYSQWGIEFDITNPYTAAENGNRKIQYADKQELIDGINKKYNSKDLHTSERTEDSSESPQQEQKEDINQRRQPRPLSERDEKDNKNGGSQHKEDDIGEQTGEGGHER